MSTVKRHNKTHNMKIHRKNSSNLIDRLVQWTGFVLLITTTSLPTAQTTPICYGKVDIIFVIDASYSILDQDFGLVCKFVEQLYTKILLDIDKELHAGLIFYASSVYEGENKISLSGDQSQIVTLLTTFQRDRLNIKTYTGLALKEAYEMFQNEGRADADQILVLITDGVADDQAEVFSYASRFRAEGIHALAIGIGVAGEKIDVAELNAIASDVSSVYIFTEITPELVTNVEKDICGQTQDSKVPPEVKKDNVKMDLYFLLDEAMLAQDLDISKQFMKAILQTFEIGTGQTLASVFLYGRATGQYFTVGSFTTEETLFTAIDLLALTAGNGDVRNVGGILTELQTRITSSSTTGPVIVVLFVTGAIDDLPEVIPLADRFRTATNPNIHLIVLGIGTNMATFTSEQNRIAYDVGTVFQADNFLSISGTNVTSTDFISSIRKTIYQLATGTFISQGVSYRWSSMFDVVFVIDGSIPMSQLARFVVVRFILKELIDEFELGADKGRVAVLLFDAAGVYNSIRFDTYNHDHATLNSRIDSLLWIQRQETVDNAVGLAAMRKYFMNNNRESASRLGYLITMGQARNKLLAEAEARALAFEGIQLMLIGIDGGVSEAELNSYQMFDPVDGPVLIAPITTLASNENLAELKADLLRYAMISRIRKRYFPWDAKFDFIVLLHDESGRVDGGESVKYFLQDLFHRYEFGVNNVLAGVITFGANVNTGAGKEIILGSDSFYTALYMKILQLSLTPTGGPNVLAALDALITMFANHGRPGAAKVALLVIQGDVRLDDLTAKIQQVRDQGISVAAVGIGPETDVVDLKSIAYNSEAGLAFLQTSWQMLQYTPAMDASVIALARGIYQPQGAGNILRLPTQCSGRTGFEPGIIFLVDASESIRDIFEDVKAFTAAMMSGFTMPGVDMGALAFANAVLPNHIPIGEYQTYVELYAHFMNYIQMDPLYRTTATYLAIRKMVEMFTTATVDYKEKVAVLLTDGKSVNTPQTEIDAQRARDAGIELVAIGIGGDVFDDELEKITGGELTGGVPHKFIFSSADLSDQSKLESVQSLICALIRPGDCEKGNYRDPVTLECIACPVGTYQELSEQLFCAKCDPGKTTSASGADSSSLCITACDAGYYLDTATGTCKICPIGEYQPNSGQTQCEKCEAPTTITKFEGSTSKDDCTLDKCEIPTDLVFVVDATASIGIMEFNMLKAFLGNQLDRFEIGSNIDETRISIVRIGTETTDADVTDFLTDKDTILNTIRELKGFDLRTNTASAIEKSAGKLDRDGRPNIAKVIFIVTDGISQNPFATRYQALLAQQKYEIVVLGVGSQYFMPELQGLASDPDYILTESNFFSLPALDAYTTICKAADRWKPPVVTVPPSVKCNVALDLILVMNLPQDLTFTESALMKAKMVNFINLLELSSIKVNVGVLSFTSIINSGQKFALSSAKSLIEASIRGQPESGLGTATSLALVEAKNMLDLGRSQAIKALILLVDSESDNLGLTLSQAAQLEEEGIYAISVGKGTSGGVLERELDAISTTGSDTTIFVSSFGDPSLTSTLESKLCPENFKCSYTLHVAYIWYFSGSGTILDRATKFSTDVSDRFTNVIASVIEVSDSTEIKTLLLALTEAQKQISAANVYDTIHNIVIITDKLSTDLGTDAAAVVTMTTSLKEAGVKILIINARAVGDVGWVPYTTSARTVFFGENFDELIPSWKIHTTLCKEPCNSGYEIGDDGKCQPCAEGSYRDKTKSYPCLACTDDATTSSTGSTSIDACTIKLKCEKPMDLIFVIDATMSIGLNYNFLKAFFWNLVDKFPVGLGDNETRIAVVKIGETVTVEDFTLLSQSVSDIVVKTSIVGLEGNEQQTNTAASLAKVLEIFQAEGRDQKTYPHIVLVATDGKSENTFQTKRYSSILKLNGIRTVVIALGSGVFQPEIEALAYDLDSIYSFASYQDLIQSKTIHQEICDAAKNYIPATTDPETPDLLGECKSYMDMVFVIDASMSVTMFTFLKLRVFIAQFARMLDIGQDKIRIGIIAFSATVHETEVFSLEECVDQTTLEVSGIQPQKWNSLGSTNTAAALSRMIDMFTQKGRQNSPFVGIVITDGKSSSPSSTKIQAQLAKDKGIHIVAIGFGVSIFAQELYDMATDPASVKVLSSFDELTTEELLDLSCSYNFTCPHEMDIIAVWDLLNFDTIRRAEIFIDGLKKSFPVSKVTNIFVDHVDDVAEAFNEGFQKHTDPTRKDTEIARVLMVITDKQIETDIKDRLELRATEAKNAGILVMMVDAAAVSNNVESFASNDKLSYVTDKFDMLPFNLVIQRSLCSAPCQGGTAVAADGSCKKCGVDEYRDARETFLCVNCPTGRSTEGATGADELSDCLFGKCRAPMDIVFVVDSSESISSTAYMWMKVFLLNTVGVMDISLDRTRVGLVPYTSDILASQVFPLQKSTKQEFVQQAVRVLRQGDLPTGTNTARAIDAAKDMILTQGRVTGGVMHIIVVITDGISTNTYRTIEEAKKAKDNFIRLYSLGVGPNVFRYELDKIASDEDSKMFVNDFITLATIQDFTETICEDSFTCGKEMNVVIFEDRTTTDAIFSDRVTNFKTKMASSYSSSTVSSVSYTSLAALDTLVRNQDMSINPQNTKLFVFITKTDIADSTVKDNIQSVLRQKGGIVVVINADKNLENTNFISMVSDSEYLFNVESFDELPVYRFIERKLCIEPCSDGEQRSAGGACEKCPTGTYRLATDSHTCNKCTGDKTTKVPGAKTASECIPNCGPGFKTVGDLCVECQTGEYQADSFQPDCDTCSSGYTTEQTKSTSSEQCIRNCDVGEKISSLDDTVCEKCEKDTYQPDRAQTECIACPVNLYSSIGSTSLDNCNDACGKSLDIIFLVDASLSLTSFDFQLTKVFLENSVLRFKVGLTATRIGLIQFADVAAVSPRLDLIDSLDRNAVISLARALIHSTKPGTNTAEALDAAVQMFDAQGRTGIHQNIVVITDGKSDNVARTELAATRAKKRFINIVSIGVGGNIYLPELRKIATDDTAVKTFSGFFDLVSFNILPTVCTPTQFTCDENMDIFYIKYYSGDSTVENQVTRFFTEFSNRYKAGTSFTLIDANAGTESLTDDINYLTVSGPTANTKILIIFTNKANSEAVTAVAVKAQGVIIAVIYTSDAQTDTSFNTVVSNPDLLFYAQRFDESPYIDFILRSLCKVPCGDGLERDATGQCTECLKGEYRTATDSHICVDCPPQTTTRDTGAVDSGECLACLSTEWPCRSGNECIDVTRQCDGTEDCQDGSDEICNDCLKGSRWDGAQCILCEQGTYQPSDGQTQCIKCPDGSTTDGVGKVLSTDCTITCDESGKELDYPNGGCVDCETGYYRDKDVDPVCIKCEDPFITRTVASTSKDDCVPNCEAGQFWDDSVRRCVDCQIGKYQPEPYKDKCEACKNGTTTDNVKSTTSNDCKDPCGEGEELPAGGKSSADCVTCPVGTYKSSSDTTCIECEPGYTTENTGSTNSLECLPNCDVGTYFDENLKKCQDCKNGEYQDEKYKKECKNCETGKTTEELGSDADTDCIVPCPAGSVLPIRLDDGSCTPCPQGTYRVDDKNIATCTKCNDGETTDQEGSTSEADCKPNCPPGQKIVSEQCEDCDIGTYQTLWRQTSCFTCPDYTTTEKTGANSSSLCTDLCPSGKEMTSQNPLVCEKCKMNFYKELGVDKKCTECPDKHITLSDGAVSKDNCVPNCQSGQRWDAATSQCVDCEKGTFQEAFYKDTCIKCREKWTTLNPGSKLSTDCKPDCAAGTYWDEDALECVNCEKDGYQPDSYQSDCIKCEEGKFTDNTGATLGTDCKDQCPLGEEMGPGGSSPTECEKCKIGTYKDGSTPNCQPCEDGFITLNVGSTASSDCKPPCDEGEYFSSKLKVCVQCEVGTYQDQKHEKDCKECIPLGWTTLSSGSTQETDCVPPCLPGSAWDSTLLQCEPCKVGEFQNEANKETCETCPSGQTTPGEGSDEGTDCYVPPCGVDSWQCSNGQCIPINQLCNGIEECGDRSDESTVICCPIGQYYSSTTNQCEDCLPGTYQDETGQTTCLDCTKGHYSPAGSDNKDDCTECPAGYEFIAGSDRCTSCPVDTYRELGMMECDDCPPNYGTEQDASTAITDCEPVCTTGQFYDSELFRCEPCPIGWYQDKEKKTKCTRCPRGTTTATTGSTNANDCQDICPPGETLVYDANDLPTTTCEPCPVGQIKDGSSVCNPCPAGYTTTGVGSTECLPNCGPGYYFPSKSSPDCLICEKGTYQPKPLKDSCIDCEAGKTTPIEGATTSLLCYDKCSDGYRYISTTDSCDVCEKGKYRERNVDADCKDCRQGFTTEYTGAATEAECVPDCSAGEFYNRDTSTCERCPPNKYQDKPYKYYCNNCPPGTAVSVSGSDEMSDCTDPCTTPGEQLQPDGTCAECEIGTAKIPPSTVCEICEPGFTTETTGSTVCVPDCEEGSYWDGTKCTSCAKGTYQPAKHKYECVDCLTGLTTAGIGSTQSTQCKDICPNGFELQLNGVCEECEKNYYRTKGQQLQCKACPDDFITFYEGAEGIDDCHPPCDVGTAWSTVTKKCEACEPGYYQDKKHMKECKACKTGKITLISGAVSEEQCVGNCEPGTYWNEAAGQCEKCEKGTYQSLSYKDKCPPCPPGYSTDNTGSKTSADCYDKCASGYTYVAATDTCEPCGYDKYRDRDKHNLCQDCTPALMTKTDTATSEDECVSRCQKGEYWDKDKRVCVKCPIGQYQPDESALTCIICEDGGITLNPGTILASDCKRPCLEGEEWDPVTKTCVPCPIGEYQDTKYEENCKLCDPGKSTQSTRSTKKSDCESSPCLPGEWRCLSGVGCVDGNSRCDGDPVNTCADGSDEAGCSCTAGQYYDKDNDVCRDCLTGTYQDQSGKLSCINCPVGFTTAGERSTSRNDCEEICEDGEKYDPADPSPNDCVQCPVGTYREKGQDSPETCRDCPVPFTTENPGAKDISYCIPKCAKGEYYNEVPTEGCKKCSLGYYQDEEYNQYSCTKCSPAGTTTTIEGATSQSDCTDVCGLGEELPVDGTVKADCRKCKIGYYKDGTLFVCKKCQAGLTTDAEGSDSPDDCYKICEAGEEFDVSGADCKPCDRGYYRDTPPTKTDRSCKPCDDGLTTADVGTMSESWCQDLCNDGLELSADKNSCEACEKGTYRKQGSGETECQSCAPGLTTATAGAATVAECLRDCGVGERYDVITDSCITCEIGTYQDVPLEKTCKDCPSWKTTLATGSDEFTDCIDPCTDGHQSVNDQCVECPRGTYREQNVQPACQSCRDQFTTLAPASATVDQCVPQCNPGYHWDERSDSCVSCESGTFNPVAYQLQCTPCPPDRPLSSADFLSCQADCMPGESWNAARQVCNWCAPGFFGHGSSFPCQLCPPGTFSFMMGATSVNDCDPVNCPAGSFLPQGTSVCQACSTGQITDPAGTGCLTCPVGQVPAADRRSCIFTSIPASLCPGGQEPVGAGGTICEACNLGYFRPAGSLNNCQACPKNQYQSLRGQTSCSNCPAGETTRFTGSTSRDDCRSDWCGGGQEPLGGSCIPCPAGKYKPDNTRGPCLPCPKNQYQSSTGSTRCESCPPLQITLNEGSTSADMCKADWCTIGGQQLRTGTTVCEPCPRGTYKPVGVIGPCILCDRLSYQDETGQTSCKPCQPDGYHVKAPGATSSNDCSADWCIAGRTHNGIDCEDCGFGRYRRITDVGCQNCPSGVTYTKRAASPSDCKDPCPVGSFINFDAGTCDLCPEGKYSDNVNLDECKSCPDGLRTAGKGAVSLDMCKENWCPGGLTYDESFETCVPCGFGSYRRFKLDPVCLPCPDGRTTLTDTASSIDECIDGGADPTRPVLSPMCTAGYIYRNGLCSPCPIGYYRAGNTTDTCITCPFGFTTRRAGSWDQSLCITMSSQCESLFDLVVALDLSNGLYSDASHKIHLHLKPWLKSFIRRLDIHPFRVRVSIIKYARGAATLVDLHDGYNAERICGLIDKGLKPSINMNVNTAAALQMAYDIFSLQGRPRVQKHVLLITDDTSDSPAYAIQTAKYLKDRQVHITVVGTDPFEASHLASSSFSTFIIPDYLHLPPDYRVVRAVCRPR